MKRGLWLGVLAAGCGGCSLDYGAFSIESDGTGGSGNSGTGASSGGSDPTGGAGGAGDGGTAGGPMGGSGGVLLGGAGGAGGVGGAAPPTCSDQYGNAPEFLLCAESATECEFNTANDMSCAKHCSTYGGECLDAWENELGSCEPTLLGADCNTEGYVDVVCVCSLGCGGGPACTIGETCSGGTCM